MERTKIADKASQRSPVVYLQSWSLLGATWWNFREYDSRFVKFPDILRFVVAFFGRHIGSIFNLLLSSMKKVGVVEQQAAAAKRKA